MQSPRVEVFRTERFVVRHWRRSGADERACLTIYQDADVSRWLERPPYTEVEQARDANERQFERYEQLPGLGWWPVVTQDTEDVVGQVALMPMPDEADELELGYHVRRDWWGRGVATEVALGGIKYAAARFPGYRVVALTRAHNQASRRVMEKLGLKYAGETVFKGLASVKYVPS